MTILYIILAIIAFILWKIYRQKEDEKDAVYNKKLDVEHEQARKERFKDYPHLYGKLVGNWLDVFAHHAENDLPLLNLAFMLYLGESTKIDFSEGSQKWDTLWNLTEELLEDLEKHHEGTTVEHLIAVCTYWQIAAEAMGNLVKENPNTGSLSSGAHTSEVTGEKLEVPPFTDIKKILSLFPKKGSHPATELSFTDEKGNFPRESKGSEVIHKRITV
ncbi:hypothetical protein IT398_00765 [Candidatus Nomurabacteria bacterium]|nr:hypothetical protein [Candidatus Nomurabacteria bacterium]